MKFYQENKINPLAGCLPLLVQMPIFLALFRVMREPYKHIPKASDLYAAFCTTSNGVLHTKECNVAEARPPEPPALPRDGPLAERRPECHRRLPRRAPLLHPRRPRDLTGFTQSRQSHRNAPNMTSQMAMISTVLPMAFGLFSLQFPAGLVLYFLVSNLWRLGQQELDHAQESPGPSRPRGRSRSRVPRNRRARSRSRKPRRRAESSRGIAEVVQQYVLVSRCT